MKIAITTDPEIPVPPILYGGIERIVAMLIDGLTAKGHEVTLFAHPDSNVPCRLVPYPGSHSRGLTNVIKNSFIISKSLLRSFDVVHSFGRLAYLSLLLPSRLPKVMSYQREPSLNQIKRAVGLARTGSLVFTGCSEYIAAQIRPIAPSFAVPNGAPLNKFRFENYVSPDAPLVFLGRIEAIKGTHLAIQIAQRTGCQLIIAGNVPLEGQAYFDSLVKPFIDDRQIIYAGPVNDVQKNALLGSASALLMPIQWNEPFGIVMAEALACGTPVIGFARGAVPEVVRHGLNGFVCQTSDEMVHWVHQITTLDRKECRRIAEEYYSEEAITNAYLQVYNQVLIPS